jgi:hypothetical protein
MGILTNKQDISLEINKPFELEKKCDDVDERLARVPRSAKTNDRCKKRSILSNSEIDEILNAIFGDCIK